MGNKSGLYWFAEDRTVFGDHHIIAGTFGRSSAYSLTTLIPGYTCHLTLRLYAVSMRSTCRRLKPKLLQSPGQHVLDVDDGS